MPTQSQLHIAENTQWNLPGRAKWLLNMVQKQNKTKNKNYNDMPHNHWWKKFNILTKEEFKRIKFRKPWNGRLRCTDGETFHM